MFQLQGCLLELGLQLINAVFDPNINIVECPRHKVTRLRINRETNEIGFADTGGVVSAEGNCLKELLTAGAGKFGVEQIKADQRVIRGRSLYRGGNT